MHIYILKLWGSAKKLGQWPLLLTKVSALWSLLFKSTYSKEKVQVLALKVMELLLLLLQLFYDLSLIHI